MEEAQRTFRPEFLNRIDEMAVFRPLSRDNLLRIVDAMLAELDDRLKGQGLSLDVSVGAKEKILEKGFKPKYGARPLRRAIQSLLEDRLADSLLTRKFANGTRIDVDVEDGELHLAPHGAED